MIAHGTVTDPLGASASDDLTVTAGAATGLRTVRRSWMSARVNHSAVVDESTWGPELGGADDFNQIMTGPITLGCSFRMMRGCNIVGVNLYKSPTAAGSIPVGMWDNAGTLLATTTLTWVSDTGGWREVLFDAPVAVLDDGVYHWGYHYPNADTNYAAKPWVSYAQDFTNYPFWLQGYVASGTGVRARGMWRSVGGSLTFSDLSTDRVAADYYIDPIAEWTDDTPGYTGGTSYFEQWENSAWFTENFPIVMFWANHEDYRGYVNAGINVMATGDSATQDNIAAFKAIEAATPGALKWIPSLYGSDMSGPIAAVEDPVLADIIVGYFTMDEPEFNQNPWWSPDDTLLWRNHARLIDSTRLCWTNLSKLTLINSTFFFAPAGVDMVTKELNIRRYASQTDIGSLDKYSLAAPESYAQNVGVGADNRYGIWTYPLGIKRMIEVTDGRVPIWGIVESTSEFPGRPAPSQVQRAVWSMLIAGARGIEYFDHRFADSDVTKDFGAFLRDPPMLAAITALNAQIQTLKDALFAADAGLIESYTSSGTMAFAHGGYATGARIPLHYTSRITDDATYLFVQAIREGTTTGTITCTALAGLELTVIGESRTVTVDGGGVFSDTFDADYGYHLYVTSETPDFSAPVNTVAPALTTDGTPETGDTISTNHGTWTGLPSAFTYAYEWQRDTVAISGATSSSYTLQTADVTHSIRCHVTATNAFGSAAANSNAVTAAAAPAPVNSIAPAITGTAETGETVTCSTGTWSGAPTYTYQWRRDGGNISGATSSSYVLQVADEGANVLCRVTATNAAGSTNANSNSITPAAPVISTVYRDAVLADSPVAYWRLKDLTDSGPNGFTLTASSAAPANDVGLVNDESEGSKKFTNDTTQTLSVADDPLLRLTSAFTVECWIRPDFMPAGFAAIQKQDHYRIRTGSDGKMHAILYWTGGNQLEAVSATTLVTGGVYHVAFTYDGTNMRLYINGAADGTATFSGTVHTTTNHVCIGKDLDSSVTGFYGAVDEVALYGSVLSSGRIAAHYAAGTA